MVTTVAAIGLSPSGFASAKPCHRPFGRHRYVSSACGMARATRRRRERFQGLGPQWIALLTRREQNVNIIIIPDALGPQWNETSPAGLALKARNGSMIAALATLAFLATLWMLVVIGAAVLETSGGKIVAALKGQILRRPLATQPVRVRHQRVQPQRAVARSALACAPLLDPGIARDAERQHRQIEHRNRRARSATAR